MLRISRIEREGSSLCLKVEGRLSGDGVALLEGELAEVSRTTAIIFLDLAEVDFASLEATQMLRAASARGARVIACSPFLSRLLGYASP